MLDDARQLIRLQSWGMRPLHIRALWQNAYAGDDRDSDVYQSALTLLRIGLLPGEVAALAVATRGAGIGVAFVECANLWRPKAEEPLLYVMNSLSYALARLYYSAAGLALRLTDRRPPCAMGFDGEDKLRAAGWLGQRHRGETDRDVLANVGASGLRVTILDYESAKVQMRVNRWGTE